MYWGVFTVIIVSPWPLKVLTNMHKFSISFCAVLLIKTCCPLFSSNWFFWTSKKQCSLNNETSGIRSTLLFGPRWTDVPRTSSGLRSSSVRAKQTSPGRLAPRPTTLSGVQFTIYQKKTTTLTSDGFLFLMRHRGFEPRTTWLKVKCSTTWANIP